jgi:hypothetical protein
MACFNPHCVTAEVTAWDEQNISFSYYIPGKFCSVSGLDITCHRYFNFWRVQSALKGSQPVLARFCRIHCLVLATFCCQVAYFGDNQGNLNYEAGPYIMFSLGIFHFLSRS